MKAMVTFFSPDLLEAMDLRKMECFCCRVILIMAISKAFELELVAGKELNKTCCLNGRTCMLGSFCACPPALSFYGCNCEHDSLEENCESVPHDTWLPKRCSMCKCWRGWLHCFRQTFLPECDGHVIDEHFLVSRTPELTLSLGTTFLLAGICLALQSYC
uniref:Cryptic/Cripto CFC domain-containing protein n=3 Tax=Canis lupus familiaris TaxID=9615 RepID=A0A8C0TCA4_CANLF